MTIYNLLFNYRVEGEKGIIPIGAELPSFFYVYREKYMMIMRIVDGIVYSFCTQAGGYILSSPPLDQVVFGGRRFLYDAKGPKIYRYGGDWRLTLPEGRYALKQIANSPVYRVCEPEPLAQFLKNLTEQLAARLQLIEELREPV